MKKITTLFLLFAIIESYAQDIHPAKWTFNSESSKDGETELIFHIKLDPEWHIYSQNTPAGGPLPMVFTFTPSSCYSLDGKVTEPNPKVEYDSTFELNVFVFDKEVTFSQKVKLKGNNCTIKGKIEYQACKEACIFLDTTFTIKVKNGKSDKSEIPFDYPVEGSIPPNSYGMKQAQSAELLPAKTFIISQF